MIEVHARPFIPILILFGLSACAIRRNPPSITADGLLKRTGIALPAAHAGIPPGIRIDQPISEGAAAAIALWNNPQLQADLATLGIARADLIDAGLLRNPRFDLLLPVGAKPFEVLAGFPLEVFWQRGRRVEASEKAYEQLAQSLIQNGLNTIRDARLAHADLTMALANRQSIKSSLDLRRRIVTITNARLRSGDISELEAMAARTDEAAIAEQDIRAEHDIVIAVHRLRFVLGITENFETTAAAAPTASPPGVEELLEKAMTSRPDLRAAEIAIAAATKRAKWERSRISLISATLNSKGVGAYGILTGPGLVVEPPIFHKNQGLIARADAEIEVASRQYLALKQRVAFDVHDARNLLLQAQAALANLHGDVIPKSKQVTQLAEQQYKKGDVSYLFVLEQTRGLVDAELRLPAAEAAIRRAQAQLERSVGSK